MPGADIRGADMYTTMQLKPLSNHLIIEPMMQEKMTKSGIYIPETADREKPMQGKVIAVGPGKTTDTGAVMPVAVPVGAIVIFKKYGPDEVEIEGTKYLIAEESDILAIVE
ncbi:MAG: hypothetical protein RIQ54_435 [Candidatus Parcubacteria bacterium]|jgi:chaperonin GroES